ncbi:hypothetical protein B0H14DRAFT_3129930 [Mycena olivaceomarginata]|nr:hypothetical protein B0H14DRAFT_3129930 [Mycena olivaceomarginata]
MLDYYENEIRPYLACLPSRLGSMLPETSLSPRQWTSVAAVLHDIMTVVLSGSSLKDNLRLAASGTCGAARILGEFVLTRGWLQHRPLSFFLEELEPVDCSQASLGRATRGSHSERHSLGLRTSDSFANSRSRAAVRPDFDYCASNALSRKMESTLLPVLFAVSTSHLSPLLRPSVIYIDFVRLATAVKGQPELSDCKWPSNSIAIEAPRPRTTRPTGLRRSRRRGGQAKAKTTFLRGWERSSRDRSGRMGISLGSPEGTADGGPSRRHPRALAKMRQWSGIRPHAISSRRGTLAYPRFWGHVDSARVGPGQPDGLHAGHGRVINVDPSVHAPGATQAVCA